MEPRAASHPPVTPLARTTSSNIPSQLLNKYQMGKLLGRGSFAKVYAARSLADKKLVAVKIIDKTQTDAAMEPRIICEIQAMRRLQHHPNILKIHEVMATKTKIFLVMELALGGELFTKVLHRGPMKERTARRYFLELVSALHYSHQNGISHRDVKPQNLLIDADGNLKVSDFGLSALAEANSCGVLHTACGTPAFTAPEVMARRRGGYDGSKADAWSCGVILFFFLSAYLPFDDSNIVAMYKKIHKREYQIPSWVSKSARSLITQLLDPNPDTRMSLEAVMKHNWLVKRCDQSPIQGSDFILNSYYAKGCKFDGVMSGSVNAFDIISLSSGLDLSGLFELAERRTEKRFSSGESVERVVERVKHVGERLGYRVEERKGSGSTSVVGLGKGRVGLVFEVLEIAEKLVVVEAKVVDGGGVGSGVEFEEGYWKEMKDGLQDVVLQWHNDII